MLLTQTIQSGDWKNEKHVPEIECKDLGEGKYQVSASVGSEIEHPNTLEHHIAWIKVLFVPEGGKLPIEIASYKFSAHGESEVYSIPKAIGEFKSDKKGTLLALSYCNLHGLWENSLEIK